jgi:EAL domain-containing protein (putative c-di-GMP-specific phosphodiesterase class I)/GGDEF domain-containing protein
MNYAVIGGLSFRIAAALICVTCIFYTAVMRRSNKKRLRSHLFLAMLLIIFINCMTGLISTFVAPSGLPYTLRLVITYICNFIYYLTHLALIPIFCIYIIVVCEVFHKLSKRNIVIFLAPFLILELVVLTNPITHFYFYYDENLFYGRGTGIYIAYIVCIAYVLFCVYLIKRFWNTMNNLQKVAMFYFMFLATSATIIQMLFPAVVCELMGEALGLMGLMIMIERDDYRLDYRTNAYNKSALLHDMNVYFGVKRDFYVICVRVINDNLYRRIVGHEGYDSLMAEISDFLEKLDDRYDSYRSSGGNFFLVCPEATKEDVDAILLNIEDRFQKSFSAGGGITNVKIKVLCAKCPDELSDSSDIILLAEAEIENIDKMVLRGNDLDFILRKISIEKAITKGMAESSFKVMYQPVYDKNTHKIASAEAFLTLKELESLKAGFPEFMSVAENTGFVTELEFRMIDSVCKFISEGLAHTVTTRFSIVIHIMSVQVLTHELVKRVKESIEKYNVDPKFLVFDVGDTIAMQAEDELEYVIDEFSKLGLSFVLATDDAGLLGLDSRMVAKFDGVSINVKKHYESIHHGQEDIILKNRTTMIGQLGMIMILSGIDSEDLYKKANKVNGNFIVGTYLGGLCSKNELQNKFWHEDTFNREW